MQGFFMSAAHIHYGALLVMWTSSASIKNRGLIVPLAFPIVNFALITVTVTIFANTAAAIHSHRQNGLPWRECGQHHANEKGRIQAA